MGFPRDPRQFRRRGPPPRPPTPPLPGRQPGVRRHWEAHVCCRHRVTLARPLPGRPPLKQREGLYFLMSRTLIAQNRLTFSWLKKNGRPYATMVLGLVCSVLCRIPAVYFEMCLKCRDQGPWEQRGVLSTSPTLRRKRLAEGVGKSPVQQANEGPKRKTST